jgi:malate dehydrogenase (oxaloacetate-decarboxylating)
MEEEKVKDIMEKEVLTVDSNKTARECAKLMLKKDVGSAIVIHEGLAVGIVTERDLVRKVLAENIDPSKVFVTDIMTSPLITIDPDSTMSEAARLMSVYGVRRIVVVSKEGSLIGIVTATDLARTLAKRKEFRDDALNAIARISPDKESPYR